MRSRHGDATRSPVAMPKVATVVSLTDYRRARDLPQFAIPMSDPATECYQPISIDDDSLATVGVLRGDLLVATLTRVPEQGQLSYVSLKGGETWIGYYYATIRGARIVSVRPDCYAVELRRERIEEVGPVTWLCFFRRAGRTLQVPFERFAVSRAAKKGGAR